MFVPKREPVLALQPAKVALVLGAIATFLFLGNACLLLLRSATGAESDILYILNFDTERNLPTLYSAGLLFLNSLLFVALKFTKAPPVIRKTTLALSIVFFFLGVDELFSYHEELIGVVRSAFNSSGIFYFAWIIPYSVASLLIFLAVIPFLRRITRRYRYYFLLSAILYTLGAIGFEMLAGSYISGDPTARGIKDIAYQIMATFEESLEMAGCIMLVYVLLVLIQHHGGFAVVISSEEGCENRS